MKNTEPELTVATSAELLGRSTATIMRFCREKNLPHRRVQEYGRKPSIRIRLLDLQVWADAMGFAVSGVASPSSTPVPPIAGLSEIEPGGNILQRIQVAERQAFRDWQEAERTGKAPMFRFRMYLALLRAFVDMERTNLKSDTTSKKIRAEIEACALEFISRWFVPVKELLARMPVELAGRCNPTDRNFAEEALRNWCDGQLNPMLSRNPFPTTTAGQ